MKNKIFFLSVLLCSYIAASSQNQTQPVTVKWYTFKEALELNKKNPRKIFVDMYTDWCGWCKALDKNTFPDPGIAGYLNTYYYPVKFNAETKDTIEYNGKTYYNKITTDSTYRQIPGARGLPHDLAVQLMGGKMSYPTAVYLDEKSEVITTVPGYVTPDKLEPILIYFKEDLYKQLPYDEYQKYFDSTFKQNPDSIKKFVKWYSLEEAVNLAKKNHKKVYMDFYTDWCPTCMMMYKTTYNNPIIAQYLNENYYPVHFNALSKDTVKFNNQTYINEGKEHPFHQLPVALLNGKMNFPIAVYIGENSDLISFIPGYMTPKNFEPWLEFFAKEYYKTSTLEEFRKTFKGKITE